LSACEEAHAQFFHEPAELFQLRIVIGVMRVAVLAGDGGGAAFVLRPQRVFFCAVIPDDSIQYSRWPLCA
jgi:hypothetical protein